MGHTHYFPCLAASTDIISDARKIIDASAVTICGPSGQGHPKQRRRNPPERL